MKRTFLLSVLMMLALSACDTRTKGMEIRTYELSRLSREDALALITPYVHEGGYLSGSGRLITVRDKPERLKLIEEMLKKYDGGGQAVDVVMEIQIIAADGFAERDTAIADIEQTLRETFRYQGYKLLDETHVSAREDATFTQRLQDYGLEGHLGRVSTVGAEKRVPLEIELGRPAHKSANGLIEPGESMSTTVTLTLGKPLVLGQSTKGGAIILVVRAK
jgi:hypothetical protein